MEQIENYKIIPVGTSKNYTNQIIGDFLILYRIECPPGRSKSHVYWLCQCQKCKQYKVINAPRLSEGINKCECSKDLSGQVFGRLTVLYKTEKRTKRRNILWHCKCECGNECDVDLGNLRSNKSQSCGCVQSKQEEKIISLLKELNFKFTYQASFPGLQTRRYDFKVIDDKNRMYIIEYDGEQYFSYGANGWNNKENFIKRRENDLLENKYCFSNNIPLIRIPYIA